MASMMRNLVMRVSVSAIVGAIVAGGIVWVSQDSVSRSNTSSVLTGYEEQSVLIAGLEGKLDQLLDANNAQATNIATLQEQIEILAAQNASLTDDISQQSTSVAALEYARLEQSETNAAAFADLKLSIATLAADLSAMKATVEPVDMPDFNSILEQMIDAVQRIDDIANSPRSNGESTSD